MHVKLYFRHAINFNFFFMFYDDILFVKFYDVFFCNLIIIWSSSAILLLLQRMFTNLVNFNFFYKEPT